MARKEYVSKIFTGEVTGKNLIAKKHIKEDAEFKEDIADNITLDAQDSGKVFYVTADAKTITLPATVAGLTFTIVNGGADGAILVTISPNENDRIQGCDLTSADNKDLLNTKATAKFGDKVKLVGDGTNGWLIQYLSGTWARQA
jgi:hypothetical protein